MSKYAQGVFHPRHPEKYIGTKDMIYRSSWEFVFATFCDNNPAVIQWASEPMRIPYRNPVTGKQSVYVPDFLIQYQDAKGQAHVELIEIKPSKETSMTEAKSQRDKLVVAINLAKWQAARAFCAGKGMIFRIVSENDIFHRGAKRK